MESHVSTFAPRQEENLFRPSENKMLDQSSLPSIAHLVNNPENGPILITRFGDQLQYHFLPGEWCTIRQRVTYQFGPGTPFPSPAPDRVRFIFFAVEVGLLAIFRLLNMGDIAENLLEPSLHSRPIMLMLEL